MSNGNGHHWSKFSWRDWSGDKALHSCSIAARGFWIEMLCVMHEGDPVGHLTMNGRPATLRQIASSANVTEKEAKKLLAELDEAGVFSRSPDGTIYCRRMVRDTAASEVGRANAEKRWSTNHPNGAPNGGGNGEATHKASGGANGNPNAKNLESELELERDPPVGPPQTGDSTPAEPGTPHAKRADGINPRKTGTNPRNLGTNPRAAARREGGYVSGGIAVLAERLIQIAAARQPHDDDDLTDERSYFSGLKVVEGGRG